MSFEEFTKTKIHETIETGTVYFSEWDNLQEKITNRINAKIEDEYADMVSHFEAYGNRREMYLDGIIDESAGETGRVGFTAVFRMESSNAFKLTSITFD